MTGYRNTSTQAERAEALQNDKAVQLANTFAGRAIAETTMFVGVGLKSTSRT